jgi:hypothetical protein
MTTCKLQVSGLLEYPLCKDRFLRARALLEDDGVNDSELKDILDTFERFPDAVDFVQAEFPDFPDVHQRLTSLMTPERKFNLDEATVDNGTKRTQNDWFDYWENIDDGRVFASMGDLYCNFKLLKKISEEGKDQALLQRVTDKLHDDFDWSGKSNWLTTSTRVNYQSDSLEGSIIHHYRSSQSDLMDKTNLLIPEYRGTIITKVVKSGEGLHYLQTLFDTKDDAETIVQALEFISEKSRKEIQVWTAKKANHTYTRKSHPKRAAGFYYLSGCFHVLGIYVMDIAGLSRGVAL